MGESKVRDRKVEEMIQRLQGQQPQQVQVQLKILGQDFTILALLDVGISTMMTLASICENVGKKEPAKAFQSAVEHLTKKKMEFFSDAQKAAEKLAPKVEVASEEQVKEAVQAAEESKKLVIP